MKLLCFSIFLLCACEHGKGGGQPPTDGGGSGLSCGGFAGTQCAADEFCDFPGNTCGASDESGTCKTRPTQCPDLAEPTCGCDGQVHGNPCDTNAAGVDTSDIGSCAEPAGLFTCGHLFCNIDDEFCQRAGSDIGGEPDGFVCLRKPAGCASNPTCACVADEACGTQCEESTSGGLTVTCFGG